MHVRFKKTREHRLFYRRQTSWRSLGSIFPFTVIYLPFYTKGSITKKVTLETDPATVSSIMADAETAASQPPNQKSNACKGLLINSVNLHKKNISSQVKQHPNKRRKSQKGRSMTTALVSIQDFQTRSR